MKKIALLLLLSLCTSMAFPQKVKIKKDRILIDDVEVYILDKERTVQTLSTLSANEFLSVVGTSYETPNPLRSQPGGQNYPATISNWVFTVKFLESGKELVTDLPMKDLAKAVYKSNMVDANGKIDGEKLDVFITKYNNENLKYKL